MDGICSAVLNKIQSLGAAGRYFIVSADEFFEIFPESAERGASELNMALKSLSENGYIDVKYSGGGLYCVASLKNYSPEDNEISTPPKFADKKKISLPIVFWSAFAGGAAGGVITALTSLLFLLC